MDDQRLNLPRYYLSYWTYTCPFFHGKLLNLLIDSFLILTWFLNSKEGNQPDFTLWLEGLLIHCLSCKLNHYWTNQIELGKAYSRSLWIKERRKERWMRQNRTITDEPSPSPIWPDDMNQETSIIQYTSMKMWRKGCQNYQKMFQFCYIEEE